MRVAALTLFSCLVPNVWAQETRTEFAIWPATAPNETAEIGPEKSETRPGERPSTTRISNVSKPTITVYPAPADKATGAAVLICPGGALRILAWDKEGTEVAEWLNSIGVTAFVLKYRVPTRQKQQRWLHGLQDCQRAMSLVRSRAAEFKVDPKRIGILGFSAGGFLSAMTSTSFDKRQYDTIDDADKVSSRPDFAVLVYPAYLVDKDDKLEPHVTVTADSPPMFFAHAWNDPVKPESSIELFSALRKHRIPAELHVFDSGGHGFGLRKTESPASHWPELCHRWMKRNGWLKKNSANQN